MRRRVRNAPGGMAALAGAALLASCAAPRMPEIPTLGGGLDGRDAQAEAAPAPVTSIRHVSSIRPYGRTGGRMHLFLFEPAEPRPLDERIRLARNEIASDPDCEWLDAPRGLIEAETERQGRVWAETYLVAPLRCS